MSADPFDSITSQVDEFGPMAYQTDSLGYTMPTPATRATARYGVRRPTRNTYEAIIYSQAPVMPTDPSRVTSRQNCTTGPCARGSVTKNVLESNTVLSGQCRQPVRGPGQPEWVCDYDKRDELQQLLIDSEARDQLIAQAYLDIANQNSVLESKPVLCKALARLYQHGAYRPLRANPNWSDEDWQVAQWYCKNCYPFVSPAGSITFEDRPLIPKKWLDNVIQTLGPAYNFMANKCMTNACDCASPQTTTQFYDETCQETTGCPAAATGRERNVFPRLNNAQKTDANSANSVPKLPQVLQEAVCVKNPFQRSESMKSFYGLQPQGASGDAEMTKQAAIVATQRAELSANNQDYAQRIYQARVKDFRKTSSCNQLRQTAFLDNVPNSLFSPLDM